MFRLPDKRIKSQDECLGLRGTFLMAVDLSVPYNGHLVGRGKLPCPGICIGTERAVEVRPATSFGCRCRALEIVCN